MSYHRIMFAATKINYWLALCNAFKFAYKVVSTFKAMEEVLARDSEMKVTEQYFSCGTVYYAVQSDLNF